MNCKKSDNTRQKRMEQRTQVRPMIYKGAFWKDCPGTGRGYLCCGYQILTPMTGCQMYCAYCILQEYLEYSYSQIYINFSDLEAEVHNRMSTQHGIVRFGTGEFSDSLNNEHIYGFCTSIAHLLKSYKNTVVEFKTKSCNYESLEGVSNPQQCIIGFSLNTPSIIKTMEIGTASLHERLLAAQRFIDQGFWVAFHCDPIIWYKNWQSEYAELIDRVSQTITKPEKIAWWSMGCFRTIPSLKQRLQKYGWDLPLFAGEMVLGQDAKLRYYRPIRVEMYAFMKERIQAFCPDITLYLCMESQEVWKETSMIETIPHGLHGYLDTRVERMLKTPSL